MNSFTFHATISFTSLLTIIEYPKFHAKTRTKSFCKTNYPLYIWSIYVNNIAITLTNLMSRQSTQVVYAWILHIVQLFIFSNAALNSVKSFCQGFLFHIMVFNSQNGFNINNMECNVCFIKHWRWTEREKEGKKKKEFVGKWRCYSWDG